MGSASSKYGENKPTTTASSWRLCRFVGHPTADRKHMVFEATAESRTGGDGDVVTDHGEGGTSVEPEPSTGRKTKSVRDLFRRSGSSQQDVEAGKANGEAGPKIGTKRIEVREYGEIPDFDVASGRIEFPARRPKAEITLSAGAIHTGRSLSSAIHRCVCSVYNA